MSAAIVGEPVMLAEVFRVATVPAIVGSGQSQKNVHEIDARVEQIFFASATQKTFPSEEVRSAFRDRWLGYYLKFERDHLYVALAESGGVAGYLTGCEDTQRAMPDIGDIPSVAVFTGLYERFPAHFHINVDPAYRSQGVGALLVSAFRDALCARGVAGVHVVTGLGARNMVFYERNGLKHCASAKGAEGCWAFLGQALEEPTI